MKKSIISILLAVFASSVLLTGCETIEGAGRDIENVGDSIENAAENND